MSTKILYLPRATHIKISVDKAMKWLAAKVTDPEGDQVGALQIMPVVEAVDDLTDAVGLAEAMVMLFEHRVSAVEEAFQKGAAKPTSDFGTQVDQRLSATQDLLRATLDRLDEIETALIRLYKPPFLAIDEHDKPRKELAQLRAKFEFACPEKPGSSD